jgi:flagellar protein FliL
MAEDNRDEAAELERLLSEADEQETAEKGIVGKLFSSKKATLITLAVLLVLLAGVGAGVYFFLMEEKSAEAPAVEEVEKPVVEEEPAEAVEKIYIFKFRNFFLPLRENGKETGKFISVTPNLRLSNATMYKEISKVQALIRKNIYLILKRKSPKDLLENKSEAKERIKREILTASNALLLSGTGTINDVFFTQFIIK